MIKKAEIGIRRNQFISQLNMVESTKRKYREALGSVFLNNIIRNARKLAVGYNHCIKCHN